ncbi:MAG: hypothetical protein Q9186_006622, partial [Xanthomendoza sp. 1 TL-2023]
AEDKLLLLQILVSQPIKPNYAFLSHKLSRSPSAIAQHINKLKNEAKKIGLVVPTGGGGGASAVSNEDASSSPAGKSVVNVTKRFRAPRSKNTVDGNDRDEQQSSGAKKAKVSKGVVGEEEVVKDVSPETEDGDGKDGGVVVKKEEEADHAAEAFHVAIFRSKVQESVRKNLEYRRQAPRVTCKTPKGNMAPSKTPRRAAFSRPQSTRPKTRNLVRWTDEMDKKLLLTVQWACNIKGVKVPWEIVATEMGPTITAGAVIQHLAKFRQRMVAQGVEVPPALTRGGNNHGPLTKATTTVKVEKSTNPGSTRRTAKWGGKLSKKDEDPEEDTEEEDFEMNNESEVEASQKKPNNPKGKAKAKGRNTKAAKLKRQAETDISDEVKDEPESSVEQEGSQTRYGVGDDMWPGKAYQSSKRARTSEPTSQSPQSPTNLVVLNIGRAGFAKLGVSGDADDSEFKENNSRQESVASDPDSDHNNSNTSSDHSGINETSNYGANPSIHDGLPDDFGMEYNEAVDEGHAIGLLPHGSFEDQFVASSALYDQDQDQSNAVSGLEGNSPALAYDAHDNSLGNRAQIAHGGPNSAGFGGIANPGIDNPDGSSQTYRFVQHSFSSPSKQANRAHDYTGPSHRRQQDSSKMALIGAHGHHIEHPRHLPSHNGSYGTGAHHFGNGGIGSNLPERDMSSINHSHPGSHSHNGSGLHSSYSSTDSCQPAGGDFAGYPSMEMGCYVETPVAMSRDNSEFDHLPPHLHSQHDTGTNWGPFFDQNFGY